METLKNLLNEDKKINEKRLKTLFLFVTLNFLFVCGCVSSRSISRFYRLVFSGGVLFDLSMETERFF
ncbi:hypothetical protein ACOWM5_01140 [Helicobacter pylori]